VCLSIDSLPEKNIKAITLKLCCPHKMTLPKCIHQQFDNTTTACVFVLCFAFLFFSFLPFSSIFFPFQFLMQEEKVERMRSKSMRKIVLGSDQTLFVSFRDKIILSTYF
jgi:hypothetical protein